MMIKTEPTPKTSRLPTWREMHLDTSPEVEKILFKRWREATPAEKLEMMDNLNQSTKALAKAGLKKRFPDACTAEIKRRYADLVLGEALAERVYGPLKS